MGTITLHHLSNNNVKPSIKKLQKHLQAEEMLDSNDDNSSRGVDVLACS